MPTCPNCKEYYLGNPERCPKCDAKLPSFTEDTGRNTKRYAQTYSYKHITAWGYVGYTILYAIPVIGLIFLLVHTFSGRNIARRSFARSFWCWLLLVILLFAGLIFIGGRSLTELASIVQGSYEDVLRQMNGKGVNYTVSVTAAPTAAAATEAPDVTEAVTAEPKTAEPTEAPTYTPVPFVELKKGDSGDAVKEIQERLIELGWLSGTADGKFGGGTEGAVKAFQSAAGLTADGVITEETKNELFYAFAPEVTATPTPKPTDAPTPTPKPTEAPKKADISQFKKTMDKYEDFFDEYCEFMTSFDEDNASIMTLAKYATMVAKYADMLDEFGKIEDDDLTDEEMEYYLQVQLRINNKLAKVVVSLY